MDPWAAGVEGERSHRLVKMGVRLPRYLVRALDGWAAYVANSRTYVVRTIVRAWVRRDPPPPCPYPDPRWTGDEDPLEVLNTTFYLPRYQVEALDWQAAVVERSRGELLRILLRAWADRQPLPALDTDPETGQLRMRAHIL